MHTDSTMMNIDWLQDANGVIGLASTHNWFEIVPGCFHFWTQKGSGSTCRSWWST